MILPCITFYLSRIDACKEDGSLGRLVNDEEKNSNANVKKVVVDGHPHLCFFSKRLIKEGEEVTFAYFKGPYDEFPWRLKVNTIFNEFESLKKKYKVYKYILGDNFVVVNCFCEIRYLLFVSPEVSCVYNLQSVSIVLNKILIKYKNTELPNMHKTTVN